MTTRDNIEKLIASRNSIVPEGGFNIQRDHGEGEGGCGVIGLASSEQVAAKHLLQSLIQMRNRGNGKGGGIAAAGLSPEEFGVSQQMLDDGYLLVIAYLEEGVRKQVEDEYVFGAFEVDHVREQPQMDDFRGIDGLEVKPPMVVQYFVRPKEDKLKEFVSENGLDELRPGAVEDEYVYQNSYRLNTAFYASRGDKEAFVLSHGKNLLVLKMVGYGDEVIHYYELEEMHAHVWIGHHRYPTKGRVWHPGGAHPFIGLNEALVHNGDFANYASITEYLAQRNIHPLFITDTEVSVQVFDLLHRTYGYPLEYVIEALAPTTERDFTHLPLEKQRVYKMLQTTHMHASPDGPWFFLIAQSERGGAGDPVYRLTGITDTSMLRPQVFAWQEGEDKDGNKVSIGLTGSEKQAIDAALESLAERDGRFWRRADRYWNARGGSHTDGGAFLFSVKRNGTGKARLELTDKFGREVPVPTSTRPYYVNGSAGSPRGNGKPELPAKALSGWARSQMIDWSYEDVLAFIETLEKSKDIERREKLEVLTSLIDQRYPTGSMRRSSLLTLFDGAVGRLVEEIRARPADDLIYVTLESMAAKPSGE
ncbi:MAG: glutamate synthase, partial [Anaerolineae bacterium]|nr:glutamate synthase [Anaerolineae bacterium]